jgi:hypothetical protein
VCLSPEADLVGAVAVGVVGIDALRQVRDKRDLPLAALPALFATHFFIETFVWWGLDGEVPWSTGRSAAWLYLFIALVVVPAVVPLAVMLGEPDARRRKMMAALTAVGVGLAAVFLFALVQHPFSARVEDHCIRYTVQLDGGGRLTAFYVLVVCGVLLLSSARRIVAFGIVNLVVVIGLAWLMNHAFISLWCAWAAITTVLLDLHLRRKHADPSSPPPSPSAEPRERAAPLGA